MKHSYLGYNTCIGVYFLQVSGFEHMKKNVDIPGVPNFIRSGKVGEGKQTLNAQQLQKIKEKTDELKSTAIALKMNNY